MKNYFAPTLILAFAMALCLHADDGEGYSPRAKSGALAFAKPPLTIESKEKASCPQCECCQCSGGGFDLSKCEYPEVDTTEWHELDWNKWIAAQCGYRESVPCADGSECDLLTPTHAVEIDWVGKWEQAIGQASHYANLLDKKPGIILLFKTGDEKEKADYLRCLAAVNSLSHKNGRFKVAVFRTRK